MAAIAADLEVEHRADSVTAVDPLLRHVTLRSGAQLAYDHLLVATGAVTYPAFAHGVSFDRPAEPEAFDVLLDDLDAGLASTIAVVVPEGVTWTLPAYDIALMLRQHADLRGLDLSITVVTPESLPVQAFGLTAAREVAAVLEAARVETRLDATAVVMSDQALMAGGRWMTVDRIVALPRLAGPRLRGLPCDGSGFVVVEEDGVVPGCADVYAAGDGTTAPIKQGGLAAHQADLVARAIARRLGAGHVRDAELPSLRGVLMTPDGPLFLEARLYGAAGGSGSMASRQVLWDPPAKVATRWLGRYLRERRSDLARPLVTAA
jgi:sulfide:quinone oxidoreductase